LLSPEDALITSGSSKAKEFSLQVMSVAGVKVSTNSDLTLTPPLVLQATVSAAEGQTLVFSDPVKVSP